MRSLHCGSSCDICASTTCQHALAIFHECTTPFTAHRQQHAIGREAALLKLENRSAYCDSANTVIKPCTPRKSYGLYQ
eukprot:1650234-Amphidinium_carterae.1